MSATKPATGFPPATEEVMESLFALATGEELLLHAESGRMAVRLEGGALYEVPGDALDDLVARGWVVPHDDTQVVETTETGGLWLRKWIDRRNKEQTRKRPAPLRRIRR